MLAYLQATATTEMAVLCITLKTYLPKGIYGAWLLNFVSARTNKRHHHHSSMRPRDTGVHAQQEPRRRPSTHQFNAISPVIANTCLPPSSSRLMIHRHSSDASRPRNARGMLGTVSSPIAQRAAAKRAAEAPRADAPGARHQKGAQLCFLNVARGTLRCRPFAPRHGAR